VPRLTRPNIIERQVSAFLSGPTSVRLAARVIVITTVIVVVAGGVLIRVLDPDEYSSIGQGMWWALQTVTTVGYGDVTPENLPGRIVAAFVMLQGIAFLTIIIAAITSTFVARAQRERRAAENELEVSENRIEDRLEQIERRLDRIEALVRKSMS
jgi:voltage-gated potassium channel